MTDEAISDFIITVRRKGTKEIEYREAFRGDDQKYAEQRASHIWTSYSSSDDRFYLELFGSGRKRILRIN